MGDMSSVAIDELIVGRRLTGPIHDRSGVLLLAAGGTITTENLDRIKARDIQVVLMHAEDAKRATASEMNAPAVSSLVEDQASINERIASLVQGGPAFVNRGPSLCHSIVRHGCKRYDPGVRAKAIHVKKECERAVEHVTNVATTGEDVDGDVVVNAAAAEIEMLKVDLENTLTSAFESGDDATIAEHSLKNAILGMSIGIELGLDQENTRTVGVAGCLQDLGMSQLSSEIRYPTRSLTLSEELELQKVPGRTVDALERMHDIPHVVRLIVYQVHERPDGSGYPRGLTRQAIHVCARTLQVSNAYVEMTSATQHRAALMPYSAMHSLVQQASTGRVDADVVRTMLHVTSLYPIGSFVTLSDSSVAQVLRSNGPSFTQPIVTRLVTAEGQPVESDDDENVIDLLQTELKIVQALPTPGRNEVAEINSLQN